MEETDDKFMPSNLKVTTLGLVIEHLLSMHKVLGSKYLKIDNNRTRTSIKIK
jgi:hypothetical protein